MLRHSLGTGRRAAAPALLARGMQTITLPGLPYDYGALQPVISGEIMELHHKKHHQAYVNGANKAMEQLAEAQRKGDVAKMIELQGALRFNGGGHLNHSMFWKMLCPPKEYEPPSGALEQAIEADWGALDALVAQFNAKAAGVQGSGWAWLAFSKEAKRTVIATTPNQDPLEPTSGLVPLLGIDVWEHAYYLQYKNARPDYLKEVWKVVNWKEAGRRYREATGSGV
ncbi:superoxide dismutase [Mn] [Micractinium conductrix]|uniref:Superoxide dismutase n=1 Tax=Micractinium conductrix TaxID=554055 RepID=A0A2P6VE45_9CHLO|nr:superoxide dismutase [Mn] [Micractinium conductrix]|eukprot:PSC72370.1 superoxide dismutase [Mn] [Micractinium conductrix]